MANFKVEKGHKYLIATPNDKIRCDGLNAEFWISTIFKKCPEGTKIIDLTDLKIVLAK